MAKSTEECRGAKLSFLKKDLGSGGIPQLRESPKSCGIKGVEKRLSVKFHFSHQIRSYCEVHKFIYSSTLGLQMTP